MVCVMSNSFLETFVVDSNRNQHVAPKSFRRTKLLAKQKSWQSNSERRPLISSYSDSNSDEEITLHDIRDLKSKNGTTFENEESFSGLRKVTCNANGVTSKKEQETDPFKNYELLYLKLNDGDTLQSISIKFHCPVADLKRANNLISSQEFYALKHLKIPVKKHSLWTESLPTVHSIKLQPTTSKNDTDSDVRTINIGIGSLGHNKSSHESAAFFKRMDEDLVKIMLSTKSQKDSLEAATAVLTAPQIQPLLKDPCNGTDCGIQWSYLIIFVIVAGLFIPIGITLYMYFWTSHADVAITNAHGDSDLSMLNSKDDS